MLIGGRWGVGGQPQILGTLDFKPRNSGALTPMGGVYRKPKFFGSLFKNHPCLSQIRNKGRGILNLNTPDLPKQRMSGVRILAPEVNEWFIIEGSIVCIFQHPIRKRRKRKAPVVRVAGVHASIY